MSVRSPGAGVRAMPGGEIDGVRRQIHEYVVANILFGDDAIDDAASLIGQGVLDSMGVLEMVLFVEEQMGVPVPDNEVLPEHFDSVNALAAFVMDKRAASAGVNAGAVGSGGGL